MLDEEIARKVRQRELQALRFKLAQMPKGNTRQMIARGKLWCKIRRLERELRQGKLFEEVRL